MTLQLCHTVRCSRQANAPETAGLCSEALLQRKMSRGEGETQDVRDETDVMVYGEEVEKWQPRGGYQLLICGEFVLRVHCSSMNVCFGDLFQMMIYMTIPHRLTMTYKTLRGVLTRTIYPPHILCAIALAFLRHFPLTSYLCLPHDLQECVILTVEHTGVCAQINSCTNISECTCALHNILFCVCVRAETGPSCCQ